MDEQKVEYSWEQKKPSFLARVGRFLGVCAVFVGMCLFMAVDRFSRDRHFDKRDLKWKI